MADKGQATDTEATQPAKLILKADRKLVAAHEAAADRVTAAERELAAAREAAAKDVEAAADFKAAAEAEVAAREARDALLEALRRQHKVVKETRGKRRAKEWELTVFGRILDLLGKLVSSR
ncbi:hypothetical protein GCM10023195_58220 [Actinoallomurus liliacearum]|uniref:ATP synthase F0 subunit B n=1 Tax=Actinoallomurus liliacearum TaxID=1080073 RepID=A0ABP8TPL3_9ACTN